MSPDRRLLSLSWSGGPDGTVRLDEFDARLDYTFAKRTPGVVFVAVAGDFAMWFDEPHEVVVLNPDGSRRRETARLAGNTLIWMHGGTTMRLEGDLSQAARPGDRRVGARTALLIGKLLEPGTCRRRRGVPAAPDPRRPPCAGTAPP